MYQSDDKVVAHWYRSRSLQLKLSATFTVQFTLGFIPTCHTKQCILTKKNREKTLLQNVLQVYSSSLTDGQDDLVLDHLLELGELLDLHGKVGDLLEVLLASLLQQQVISNALSHLITCKITILVTVTYETALAIS